MNTVASLKGCGGSEPPRVTPSRGVTPEGKKIVGKFTKNSGEKRSDRLKKVTPHPGGCDTRVKAIKSDSDSDEQKKVARFFRKKNRRVTPSVAAPGVTHPSDATG